MSDFIKIYDAIFNSGINTVAFGLIIILSTIAIIGIYRPPLTRLRQYSNQSPAILTTVGVCFSFLGIALGLIDFDPSNIEKSIPLLLDSLKTKFIASLMGILASILVKILQSFRLDKPKINTKTLDLLSGIKQAIEDNNKNTNIIDLLSEIKNTVAENNKNNPENLIMDLKGIISVLPEEFEKQSKLLLQVKNSLAGEGDASVTTQLMKMRTDVKDALTETDKNNQKYLAAMQQVTNKGFNTLIDEFRSFAEKMAEDNSKTLIEALENVMKDFNSKINEQFGDNFKQLNIAVGNLLIWQENYKNHVESLTDNFEITLKSVEAIESSFGYIQERSENFAVVSEKLDGLLIGVNGELRGLNHHLKAFDELADNAKGAFPIIEDNLQKLTAGFKQSTEQSLANINSTVTNMQSNLGNATDNLKKSTSEFNNLATIIKKSVDNQEHTLIGISENLKVTVDKTLNELSEQSKSHLQNYELELQRAVQAQMNHLNNAINSSSEQFNKLLIENTTKSTNVLEQQTKLLDAALQEELRKSLETMGGYLAALSNQFVNDYKPLTEQLRQIVQLANNVNSRY